MSFRNSRIVSVSHYVMHKTAGDAILSCVRTLMLKNLDKCLWFSVIYHVYCLYIVTENILKFSYNLFSELF
jgi:hypothetical protein